MEKDRKINGKLINSVKLLAIIIFILMAAFYYYALHLQYPPSSEDLIPSQKMYLHLKYGTPFRSSIINILDVVLLAITCKLGGLSYFSVRLYFTLYYVIILLCVILLSLPDSDDHKRMNMYLLPMTGLFMVPLFPAAMNPNLVWYIYAEDLHYQWPFDYHYIPRVFVFLCLVMINSGCLAATSKKRKFWGVLTIVTCIYAMMNSDLIFYIMFVIPLSIVFFLRLVHTERIRGFLLNNAYWLVSIVMILLLVSRLLPILSQALWINQKTGPYIGIYGGTNWVQADKILDQFLSYIDLIFLIFNIQLQELPVISLYTILYALKMLILLTGYILIFHILKKSIQGKSAFYHYSWIDEILAWSYLLLSFVYIFTEFGHIYSARYFPGLVSIMTILICRNIKKVPAILHLDIFAELKYKKIMLFIFASVCCICSMKKAWLFSAPDTYAQDIISIIDYINETEYGYALASHWIYARMSAASKGEVIFFPSETEVKETYGQDSKVAYIVTCSDGSDFTRFDHCEDKYSIRAYYSEPTEVICLERLTLLVFENGIG